MKLLIISNMAHYYRGSQVVGWGPTVEEINHLSTLFQSVRHIGCLYPEPAPDSALPYSNEKITLVPVPPAGGESLLEKLRIVRLLPLYIAVILNELRQADVVHLRCPANIPLLSLLVLLFKRQPIFRWVKYAGNWQPDGPDAWSYQLQRWILRRNFHRGVVTINGSWLNQPDYIYSFLNPCLNENEIRAGAAAAREKHLVMPYRFLFVGRLEKEKGVERILALAASMQTVGIEFMIDLVGDGPRRMVYEKLVQDRGLQANIRFHGWKPRTELGKDYTQAHFLLLPSSSSEGWPKVLSEGMAYGVVPLASTVSSIPQIIRQIGCGRTAAADDIGAFLQSIQIYIANPEVWEQEKDAGTAAARRFSYPTYLQAVRDMARDAWGIEL